MSHCSRSFRSHYTYAYTNDIGRALVALALDESTSGQVWHLPVGEPVTVGQMTKLFNQVLGTQYTTSFMPTSLCRLLSLGIPPLREVGEMLYQFDTDYIFSYDQFQQRFPDFVPTPYAEGVEAMVASFRGIQVAQSNI